MADVDYTPPPTIEDFILEYIPSGLFYNFIIGPFGSGKTTGNFFKLAYMASLQAPSPVDGIRRSRAVVVRNTAPQLRDTTIASWMYWFKDGQAGTWKATDKNFVLRFGDVECEVMFRPLDTPDDISRVLSLEVTFAILDEFVEIPREIVEALSGRCGRYPPAKDGGATNWGMWGASNPGTEDSWWYAWLVENRPENVFYYHQPSGLAPEAENTENLPRGYYDNLVKGKTEAWIHQFVHANWGYSTAGKPVVPTFNRAIHVAQAPLRFDPLLPVSIGFDPGMHSALIVGQQDLYGRLHVLDEIILEGFGAKRMVSDRLLPLLKRKYAGAEVVIAPDPAANSRTPTDEQTVVQVLKDQKYRQFWTVKVPGTNLLAPRLEAIEHYTTRLTDKGPALVIDPGCKTLIRALGSGWRYPTTKAGDDRPLPEKNVWSHPGDAFGYLCQHNQGAEVRHGRRTNAQARPALPRFTNSYVLR